MILVAGVLMPVAAIDESPPMSLDRVARTLLHRMTSRQLALPICSRRQYVGSVTYKAHSVRFSRSSCATDAGPGPEQRCSVSFAKPPPGTSPALVVAGAVPLRHCNGLCRPDFSRAAPAGLLCSRLRLPLAQRKIPPSRRRCWPVLPARPPSPPAVAPCGLMLVRRFALFVNGPTRTL